MWTEFLPWPIVEGQGVIALNWKRIDLDSITGSTSLLGGQWDTSVQGSCVCPIPGKAQGWGFEQPDLVQGALVYGRGLELDGL